MPPRPLLLALPLLAALPAWAGGRVALPASEPREAWAAPLASAGLTLAPAGGSADVALAAQGDRWIVALPGAAPLRVLAPDSPAEREDLALLLASLVLPGETLDWGVLGPAPPALGPGRPSPPAPASARPPVARGPARPRPAQVAPPAPAVAPPPERPVAALTPPTLTALPEAPGPLPSFVTPSHAEALASAGGLPGGPPILPPPRDPPPPLSAWIEAGTAAALRAEVQAAPTLGLGLGLRRGDWQLGARGLWSASAGLERLGEGRQVQTAGLLGGVGWGARWASAAGGLGVWRQVYLEDDLTVDQNRVPTLWFEPRLQLPLPGGLQLGLGALLSWDLRPTELWVGDEAVADLSRGAIQTGIWLSGRWGDQLLRVAPHPG